jgi:hypothetical protein
MKKRLIQVFGWSLLILSACLVGFVVIGTSHSADSSSIAPANYISQTQRLVVPVGGGITPGRAERGVLTNGAIPTGSNRTGTEGNINLVCPPGTMMARFDTSTVGYIPNPINDLAFDRPTTDRGRQIHSLGANAQWRYIPTCLNVDTTWTGNCTNTLWTSSYFQLDDMGISCSQQPTYEWFNSN